MNDVLRLTDVTLRRGENQVLVLLWIAIGFLILVVPLIGLQRLLERRLAVSSA